MSRIGAVVRIQKIPIVIQYSPCCCSTSYERVTILSAFFVHTGQELGNRRWDIIGSTECADKAWFLCRITLLTQEGIDLYFLLCRTRPFGYILPVYIGGQHVICAKDRPFLMPEYIFTILRRTGPVH